MAVVPVRQGSLLTYQAEGITVPHAFTTRLGGVSEGDLASMNIGTRRGDPSENVAKNYEILGSALGFAPERAVLTRQTHTDIVLPVDSRHHGTGLSKLDLTPCDGLVTNTPGTALVVFTADCTPILLFDPVTGAVGAVHAGWRGTAAAIAAKAVAEMTRSFGCRPEDIRAAIGPNIGQCCFETDGDVPEAMVSSLGDGVLGAIRREGKKYYVNLKEINRQILAKAGVTKVEISELCTACNTRLFWSHRRMGASRGSQGAVILCKEKHL